LFTNVAQSNRIAQEEIFGPVVTILTFRTDDEVIEKANNSPYGLSAGVWTDKGSKIFNMTRRMRAGVIWANTFNKFDPSSPFGGYKESGFGREGACYQHVNLVNDDMMPRFETVPPLDTNKEYGKNIIKKIFTYHQRKWDRKESFL
jgi:acyl-CoA reductase-like NAD-dependent aldehyde dehydrogenase